MARETLLQALWRLNRPIPLAIGALALLNLALYLGIALGISPRLSALERQYIERQAEERRGGQRVAEKDSSLGALDKAERDLQAFREMIPPRADFTALIGEVFSLAQGAGLEIQQVNYSPEEIPEERLLTYTLTFSVTGTYAQIKLFIHSLEQSERLIAIEKIGLGSGGEPGLERVNLRLVLSTVFRAEIS